MTVEDTSNGDGANFLMLRHPSTNCQCGVEECGSCLGKEFTWIASCSDGFLTITNGQTIDENKPQNKDTCQGIVDSNSIFFDCDRPGYSEVYSKA